MTETEPLPVNEDLETARKAGRRAHLLEFLAIVVLAALAAYAAST